MSVDVFILNTAVADLRSDEFAFTESLVGPGGLAKCDTRHMPDYTQQQYSNWIGKGQATAGGPGNATPLVARAGVDTAVGVNLGKGDFGGLDAQGRFFYDVMLANNVDMSQTYIHPDLPTGTTFIYDKGSHERGGIAYFPNANNDFSFEHFKNAVEKLNPAIVYYMYSGLSDRGDANGGRDLADFMSWCRQRDIVTIADSHTLTGNPDQLISSDAFVREYKLLEPLLPELDIFFTSYDEARMIENTLGQKGKSKELSEGAYICHFLDFLAERFFAGGRTRFFGVTVKNGAYHKYITPDGRVSKPVLTASKFMIGDVIDLVGAGDSFRAGLITYIARNINKFKAGSIEFPQAVQMGNLFASLYIKAPLNDRYGNIGTYDKMLRIIQKDEKFESFDDLIKAVKQKKS
jgi:sugar/nucleoside kinase (ribokinase family)